MTFSSLFKGHVQTTLVPNLIAVFLVLEEWDGGEKGCTNLRSNSEPLFCLTLSHTLKPMEISGKKAFSLARVYPDSYSPVGLLPGDITHTLCTNAFMLLARDSR